MGKLKSINGKLQLYLMTLLLMVIIIIATPVYRRYPLTLSVMLFFTGVMGIRFIIWRLAAPLNQIEKDLETEIQERANALETATEKLKITTAELQATQQNMIHLETQKSLTSIVAGFAHEINNPLTGILGYIDLMELNDDLSAYSKKRLEGIKDQAIRIRNIIDELNWLDPELEQVKSDIDLANLLEKMIKIIRQDHRSQGITFEKEFTTEALIVRGNHFALWQVFEGIIENAIEAIHGAGMSSGKIRVILKKSAEVDEAIAEIEDNAGGFASIEKAFNPFFTTKSRTHKRGIGLSIAFNVVLEHKGNIKIKNNELGATVAVHLPCGLESVGKFEKQTDSTIHHKNQILEDK